MEIKRRKTVSQSPVTGGAGNSASNSGGDDMGSTSTGSMEAATTPRADLSNENEKLKKDNEKLSCELAKAKKQCEDLVGFLKENLNVGPEQINHIIRQGTCGSTQDAVRFDDDDNVVGEDVEGEKLKLFGVWLKNGKEKMMIAAANGNCRKRGREEESITGANKL